MHPTETMPPIQKLDRLLVDKIAAGEVIERPASVVKELVENALDAGASRIDIAIEAGGAALIRVTDDGHGIASIELPLAVAPHATSKIVTADDLFDIRSLGFRGEALASIASVSHLTLRSRTAEQLEAYEVSLEGGIPQAASPDGSPAALRPRPCAGPQGTTIEVRNLFYNVPARRKFLRQPQTECGRVTEQIARLALAHPATAFTLMHNGRPMRNLPATENRRERIADFYGAELAECLMPIDRSERGLKIEALIAPPDQSRASTKWQYLFLNGRYITDRRIGFAIREAFRGLVEHTRFPVVFIFLTTDPAAFDVNVHPTKIEVRWRDAGLIQSQVLAVLRETLLSHDLTPKLRVPADPLGQTADPRDQQRARQALADYLKRVDPTQTRLSFQPPPFPTQRIRASITGDYARPQDASERAAGLPDARDTGTTTPNESPASTEAAAIPSQAGEPEMPSDAPASSVLQIHNTYLVAQTEDGFVIIDQHALHERILYERFRNLILAGPLESQRLLIPEVIDVSAAQAGAAETLGPLLAKLGIELSTFGPGALAVQSFPTLLSSVEIRPFVADLLDKLAESEDAASEEEAIHAALDMMACKAAVKAGDALSAEEIHALLLQRHLTERKSNCPHGRPTTLELTTQDLERQFKRT